MDINDMRAVSTLLAFIAFIGIVWWAWRGRSRKGFDEAAQLPFADDEQHDRTVGGRRE
jgi:cytochrome c oxidase cbb3-type subunit 4